MPFAHALPRPAITPGSHGGAKVQGTENVIALKPWIDPSGAIFCDSKLREISKVWSPETWEQFLQETVDVPLDDNETLVDIYRDLLEDQTEPIWSGPCRVPQKVKTAIESSVRGLAPQQRKVIRGIYFHDLTGIEVAKITGTSPQNVQKSKANSLNKIKSLLETNVDVRSYLLGGSENLPCRERSLDEQIVDVYRLDLRGSVIK